MNKKRVLSISLATLLLAGFVGEIKRENDIINEITKDRNEIVRRYDNLEKKYNNIQNDLDYYKSDEYVESIKIGKMSEATGLDVESYYKENFKFTYYTSHPSENGGYTVTCNGKPLQDGIVASNYYPQGTKLYIGGQVYTVADRGSSRFNSPNRLDVFVGRQGGESDSEYLNRVNNMGVKNIEGYVLEI